VTATTVDTTPRPQTHEAVPMTDEQKFVFDMKGWLLLPGVLEPELIRDIKKHLHRIRTDYDHVPPHERHSYGGIASELLDHPAIVGVLRTILNAPDDKLGKSYGFRCDGSYFQYRGTGDKGIPPHGGGPSVAPNFTYQCKNQQMFSGLTRVVWELNEVEKGAGGTLLMSGSHKANFSVPVEHLDRSSWLFETYSCPPGSVLFFTENLCHSGAEWKGKEPRIAVFNAYTHVQCQYHKMRWDPAAIAAMPEKRRTLFRGVWGADFHQTPAIPNDWYGEDNRAY
jgi:hypothetical protein